MSVCSWSRGSRGGVTAWGLGLRHGRGLDVVSGEQRSGGQTGKVPLGVRSLSRFCRLLGPGAGKDLGDPLPLARRPRLPTPGPCGILQGGDAPPHRPLAVSWSSFLSSLQPVALPLLSRHFVDFVSPFLFCWPHIPPPGPNLLQPVSGSPRPTCGAQGDPLAASGFLQRGRRPATTARGKAGAKVPRPPLLRVALPPKRLRC